MASSRRIIALDLGAAHVARAAFGIGSGGRLILESLSLDELSADPAQETGWLDEATGVVTRTAARGGAATLAVPGHLALTKFIKTPSVEKSKRAKILQFEAGQNIPYALDEVVWDHLVVADDGMDLEVMLLAVKTDVMAALCAGAQAAGLQLVRALPGCLALRQAFLLNQPDCRDSVLLVDVGARSTDLVFLEPGRFFVRTLPLAGNTITQIVADELQLGFAAAEQLKVQVLGGHSELPPQSPARAAVLRAAESFGARLHLEITRSTVNLRRHAATVPVTAVQLTGGGASFAALAPMLAEKLKLPVQNFDPLARLVVAPGVVRPHQAGRLAVMVGAAAAQLLAGGGTATLLPAALGDALEARRRRPILIMAAVLGVLALLPPIWHFHRRAKQAEASITAIDAQLRPLRSLQSRNAANLERIDQVKKQIDALHSLAETKANWINFFTDLQARLVAVEDVWLEQLAVVRAAPEHTAGSDAESVAPPPLRLKLSGRLLDKNNPVSKVSADSYERVKRLLASFKDSRFIADVENERFDNRQPGILHFDFTLVVNPKNPL